MSDAQTQRIDQKDQILDAALMHTAFDGWSRKALLAAADEVEIDHQTARRLFPRDGQSLIEWLDGWLDRRMEQATASIELENMPVRKRISALVGARLEALGPHQEAMRRATLTRGLPQNILTSGRGLWRTADRIWELAGFPNQASDGFSRYSRRALLVGILTSTFLFWLEDMSEGFKESFEFLDRRIDDALKLGKVTQQIKRFIPKGSWRPSTA